MKPCKVKVKDGVAEDGILCPGIPDGEHLCVLINQYFNSVKVKWETDFYPTRSKKLKFQSRQIWTLASHEMNNQKNKEQAATDSFMKKGHQSIVKTLNKENNKRMETELKSKFEEIWNEDHISPLRDDIAEVMKAAFHLGAKQQSDHEAIQIIEAIKKVIESDTDEFMACQNIRELIYSPLI